MHTRSIRPHSPYEIACWACVIGRLKFVHFVTGGPFGLHGFGRFAGLPSEDLQQHGVIYLIVLGFAAAGIAAMLFFCEESYGDDERRRQAAEYGAANFLAKPVEFKHLKAQLRQLPGVPD